MKVFATIAFIIIFFYAVSLAQEPLPVRRDSARHLIIQLNRNYISLDRSLKELEGEIKGFPGTILNLSAINKSSDIRLLFIEAWDDLRLLGSHIYTSTENEALTAGGRHQLYEGEAKEGSHKLKIVYYWTMEDKPPQKGEILVPLSVSKGMSYFIELSLEKRGEQVGLNPTQFEFSNR